MPKKPGQPAAKKEAPRPRRTAGRPAGVTQQTIVETALELLQNITVDELSFARLAQQLQVSPMTLYNYFPNRQVLFDAVATHAFSLFEIPIASAKQSWQQQLLTWMWAVQRHCQRYPVVLKVMGFEGSVSHAWVAAVTPAYRILRELGFDGRELAQISSWLVADAMGIIIAEGLMPMYRRPPGLAHLEELDSDAQGIHLSMRKHLAQIDSDEWLEFGFRRLITSLEQAVGEL